LQSSEYKQGRTLYDEVKDFAKDGYGQKEKKCKKS
jgi:hypothetical protein